MLARAPPALMNKGFVLSPQSQLFVFQQALSTGLFVWRAAEPEPPPSEGGGGCRMAPLASSPTGREAYKAVAGGATALLILSNN